MRPNTDRARLASIFTNAAPYALLKLVALMAGIALDEAASRPVPNDRKIHLGHKRFEFERLISGDLEEA